MIIVYWEIIIFSNYFPVVEVVLFVVVVAAINQWSLEFFMQQFCEIVWQSSNDRMKYVLNRLTQFVSHFLILLHVLLNQHF